MAMTAAAKAKPGQEFKVWPSPVALPVCPECGSTGKNPGGYLMSCYCTGPAEESHSKRRMVDVTFRPVRPK